jgi:FAD/FMN-containing dehydrogenase
MTLHPPSAAVRDRILGAIRDAVGERGVIDDPAEMQPMLVSWRDGFVGSAAVVVQPATTTELQAVVRICAEAGVPIVVQGGNTGVTGGGQPREGGDEVLISMRRLNRIRSIDVENDTMVVEAGCVLADIQAAARQHDRLFPLSLGAEGSCTIGGNIATNAGGTAVLSYGNTRDLVLGLEVVLADGRIWNGLRGLRKDNAGYDLKQLFIGSEGTLGVITGAVLKLKPRPAEVAVAMAGMASPEGALRLLGRAQAIAGSGLTGFELMIGRGLRFAVKHLPGARSPFAAEHAWSVLLEISTGTQDGAARTAMEVVLGAAIEAGDIEDAVVAESLGQAEVFWALRHGMSEVQKHEGGSIKHDVSVAVADVPAFLKEAVAAVEAAFPGSRPVPFGHMGDGNIHFNVSQPEGADKAAFLAEWDRMNAVVHGVVARYGGSVAAEHGVGRLKRDLIAATKSSVELDLMRRVKAALDPKGILNPGRVI